MRSMPNVVHLISVPRSASTTLYNLLLQNPVFTQDGTEMGRVFLWKARRFAPSLGPVLKLWRPLAEVAASWKKLGLDSSQVAGEVAFAESVAEAMGLVDGLDIEYREIAASKGAVLDRVYEYLGMDRFEHDVDHVVRVDAELDVYPGQHQCR